MNEHSHKTLAPGAAQELFQRVFDQYIGPELDRRVAEGRFPADAVIRKFQVLFAADGSVGIEINDEANIHAALADPDSIVATLQPGDELQGADLAKFGKVVRIEPGDLRHADLGFISAAYIREGEWAIGFDFRLNLGRADRIATTAAGYLEIARSAEAAKTFAPLVDNLYAAYELAAKALLWAHPRGYKFTDKMRKGEIQQEFHAAFKTGLFPKRWATAFRELWDIRNPNRYAYEGAQSNWKAVPRWFECGAEMVAAAEALGDSGRLKPDLPEAPLERS